jgi:hypothetical protein
MRCRQIRRKFSSLKPTGSKGPLPSEKGFRPPAGPGNSGKGPSTKDMFAHTPPDCFLWRPEVEIVLNAKWYLK